MRNSGFGLVSLRETDWKRYCWLQLQTMKSFELAMVHHHQLLSSWIGAWRTAENSPECWQASLLGQKKYAFGHPYSPTVINLDWTMEKDMDIVVVVVESYLVIQIVTIGEDDDDEYYRTMMMKVQTRTGMDWPKFHLNDENYHEMRIHRHFWEKW